MPAMHMAGPPAEPGGTAPQHGQRGGQTRLRSTAKQVDRRCSAARPRRQGRAAMRSRVDRHSCPRRRKTCRIRCLVRRSWCSNTAAAVCLSVRLSVPNTPRPPARPSVCLAGWRGDAVLTEPAAQRGARQGVEAAAPIDRHRSLQLQHARSYIDAMSLPCSLPTQYAASMEEHASAAAAATEMPPRAPWLLRRPETSSCGGTKGVTASTSGHAGAPTSAYLDPTNAPSAGNSPAHSARGGAAGPGRKGGLGCWVGESHGHMVPAWPSRLGLVTCSAGTV
jgi:hypothetical protein